MYKKCSIILYICIVLIGFLWIFMKKSSLNEASQKSILSYRVSDLEEIVDTFREMEASEDELGYVDKHETIAIRVSKENEFFSPKMHRVNYQVIQKENRIVLDENDYDILCCIVEAEAGGEDYLGKKLVAEVVLNRVESAKFPNTVEEVVFQQEDGVYQFSPVADGRFYRVTVSEETKQAVDAALSGEDESRGALYFINRKYSSTKALWWFDNRCTPLFFYGGHEFFS